MSVNLALNHEEFFRKYGRPKYISLYTLGCKVNQYDTQAVLQQFNDYVEVDFTELADVYIVNTCTVTHLSDRKCRQILRKAKKINPSSILVAMGCYVQAASDKILEEISDIDILIGTNKRSEVANLVESFAADKNNYELISCHVDNIMEVTDFEELSISQMSEHTRVYLTQRFQCRSRRLLYTSPFSSSLVAPSLLCHTAPSGRPPGPYFARRKKASSASRSSAEGAPVRKAHWRGPCPS